MISDSKAEAWLREVSERFAHISQFSNSNFYERFAEWEEQAWEILETNENELNRNLMLNEIYDPVSDLLTSALDDIEWLARGSASFREQMDDLIYPDAWLYWNERNFEINTNILPNLREWEIEGMSLFQFNNDAILPILDIPLTRLSVDPGAMVYVGNASAVTLHLACDVPAIPNDLDCAGTVSRVLDPELERNQWQRSLITNRVKHISSFLNSGNSFFVNPVILHLDQSVNQNAARVDINEDNQYSLRIDLSQYCGNGAMDGSNRPLNLIDGQHRVRGSARSNLGDLLQMPFILIPPTYGPDNAAKLFTEINTTSKELDRDHQLFLAYRFMITHHDRALTMGQFVPEQGNFHDRANRLAYEMAARLSNVDGPLESRIQMLKSNGTKVCVDITKWLKYAKQWFLPGGAYAHANGYDIDHIAEELSNYFSAWISVIGESWITQNNPGWNQRTIFQYKTHFRVLLTRFSQVYSITRNRVDNELITMNDFVTTLFPLQNLDSSSQVLKNVYLKTSEFYWQCMDAWVMDALDHGMTYEAADVMSETLRSQPGRGVLSPPVSADQWVIMDDENGNWPAGQAKYLQVQRPSNSHSTLKIQILDGENVLTGVSRKSINSPTNGIYRVPIRAGLIPDNVDEIIVRLEWRNAVAAIERNYLIQRPD